MSYSTFIAEDQRRVILATLEGDPGYSHNEHVLRSALGHWGHAVSRDALRTELSWLVEQGLVTLAGETVWTARLTARGEDVALGRARVPGVARPPLE